MMIIVRNSILEGTSKSLGKLVESSIDEEPLEQQPKNVDTNGS